MARPQYYHSFALNEEYEKRLRELMNKGAKIIDIIRRGIKVTEVQIEKEG